MLGYNVCTRQKRVYPHMSSAHNANPCPSPTFLCAASVTGVGKIRPAFQVYILFVFLKGPLRRAWCAPSVKTRKRSCSLRAPCRVCVRARARCGRRCAAVLLVHCLCACCSFSRCGLVRGSVVKKGVLAGRAFASPTQRSGVLLHKGGCYARTPDASCRMGCSSISSARSCCWLVVLLLLLLLLLLLAVDSIACCVLYTTVRKGYVSPSLQAASNGQLLQPTTRASLPHPSPYLNDARATWI
jgi:hypothetical protein